MVAITGTVMPIAAAAATKAGLGAKAAGLFGKTLTGLNVLGAASLPFMFGGGALDESYLQKGPTDGKFDIPDWQLPFVNEETLMPRFEKRRYKDAVEELPGFAAATMLPGVPAYTKDQDPTEWYLTNKGAIDTASQTQEVQRGLNLEKIISTARRNTPEFIEAQARIKQKDAQQQSNFLLQMGYINKQMENEYNHTTAILQNQANIAQNNLTLSMGELDLKRQDQERRYGLYEQQLEDVQKYRNNALLAAALDGISLTVGGLVNS